MGPFPGLAQLYYLQNLGKTRARLGSIPCSNTCTEKDKTIHFYRSIVDTHWILQEVDESSEQFSEPGEDDPSLYHEVRGSYDDSKDCPRVVCIGEVAEPGWRGH